MMSNSPLVNHINISPNSTNPRRDKIRKITIHHVAGDLSVERVGEIFKPSSRRASSNYGVDNKGRVGMYVEEKNRAWTSSSAANDNQAVTIEVANNGGAPNWPVSDVALEKTIELCVDICKRNGIEKLNFTGDEKGNLTMHKWFAATNCPGPYLESKFPYIADEVNKRLNSSNSSPSSAISILGKPTATVEQMEAWAKSKNANQLFIDLAPIFYEESVKAGVNPIVTYCQSAKETGYMRFGGVLNASFKNPCGLKTNAGGSDTNPNAHQRFNTWEEGIRAQVDHLALYAGAPGYPKPGTPDPRHFPYLKGTAKTVEELGGKWAPSASYGTDIAKMVKELESTKAATTRATYYVQTGAYSSKANAESQLNRVKNAGFDAILKQSNGLFKVQTGAFSVKSNAENLEKQLKSKGFDTYITTAGGSVVSTAPGQPAKEIKVGSKVRVKHGAKTYTGGNLANFVYARVHDVQQISGDRVVIGSNGQVTAAMKKNDLILQ